MKHIHQLPQFDRPREKLITSGPEALSETELLAVLIGSGIKGKHVMAVARSVLKLFEKNSNKPDVKSLMDIEGIGLARACQIAAAVEFSRRRFFRESAVIETSGDVLPFILHIAARQQENFLCLSLNGGNEIISNRVLTIGLLNSTQIHPREVFADAIADRAAAVILAHNHPSGILKPSNEDIMITHQLVEAGRILGISVMDHIIIAKKGYFSFKDEGLI